MIPPQAARSGGRRSGGVSPVPLPLRSTYLGGGKASSVEPGGAPLGVRLTRRGAVVAGFIAAFAFLVAVWLIFFLIGVVPAAAGVILGAVAFVVIANVSYEISKQK